MSTEFYPLYSNAIIVPIIAFPAWILAVPPMVWHFSQHNIAAGSLILWSIITNFFNSINPLIWPRDNVLEWWDGNVFCDVQVRIQVGATVALASCVAMIMRRLAKVMDTRNITIVPSHNGRVREKALEVLWCWGYPGVMMLIYYIVQSARYFIFSISGCIAAYDASWPSIVLSWMWGPITMCFAAFYAGLLVYRLYRYRREFHRLIAARNTTRSRFLRLFIMAMILLLVYLPYSFWILYSLASKVVDDFHWDIVHGPNWNSVIKVPVQGVVRYDKWGQIATGYLAFFVFGTGSDANSTYKQMLCTLGLGKIFPSLYKAPESGTSTPSSLTFARGWCSTMSSKAKSIFSKNDSVTETLHTDTRNTSVALTTPTTARSESLHPISTTEPMLQQHSLEPSSSDRSFFARIFTRRNRQHPILPLFSKKFVEKITQSKKSPADTVPGGVYARAWSSESATQAGGSEGVHVVLEVRQDRHEKNGKEKEGDSDLNAWV